MKYTNIIIAVTFAVAAVSIILSTISIVTPSAKARSVAYSYNEKTGIVTLPRLLVTRSCPLFGCAPSAVTTLPAVSFPLTRPDITPGTCAAIQRRNIPCKQPFAQTSLGYISVSVPHTIVAAARFASMPPPSRCISIPQCPDILVNSSTCEHAFHNPMSAMYGSGNTTIRCSTNQALLYNTSIPCRALRKCTIPQTTTTTTTVSSAQPETSTTPTTTSTTVSRTQNETTTTTTTTTTSTTTTTTRPFFFYPMHVYILYGVSCIALEYSTGPSIIISPGDFGMPFIPTTGFPGYSMVSLRYYVTETAAYVVANGNIVEASEFSLVNGNTFGSSACAQIPPDYIFNVVLYTRISSFQGVPLSAY